MPRTRQMTPELIERLGLELSLCAETGQQVSNGGLRVLLRLIENSHFECGGPYVFKTFETCFVFEVGIGGHPRRPPRDLAVPDFGLFLVEKHIKQAGWRESDEERPVAGAGNIARPQGFKIDAAERLAFDHEQN